MLSTEKLEVVRKWLGTGSINIFGRPFAGKDAQGLRLAQFFNGNLIGGGEILRNSEIPEHVQELIRNGKLAPTEDYIKIVLPFLSQPSLAGKPLMLSSVGRWYGEEEGVVKAVAESGHPLKVVIYLDISNNESRTRWCARNINNDRIDRHDDTEQILDTRFAEFEEKTLPVIKYFRNRKMLIDVDGKGTRDEVTHLILDALYDIAVNQND